MVSRSLRARLPGGHPLRPESATPQTGGQAPRVATWAVDFWAAFVTLALLKAGLIGHTILAGEAVEPVWRTLAKSLLFFGGDVASAAILASGIWLAMRTLRLRSRRGWLALAIPGHLINGLVAAISTLAEATLGGPLTKQSIEVAEFMVENWTPQLTASLADYLDASTIVVVVGASLLGPGWALVAPGPRRPRSHGPPPPPGRRARTVGRLLALQAALTLVLVPQMTSGRIGVRMTSRDLDHSPWLTLLSSYVRSPLRRMFVAPEFAQEADAFRFDFASISAPPDTVVTPLVRARPKRSNVFIVLLESIGSTYMDDPSNPMPYLRSLRDKPGVVELADHYATWSMTTHVFFSLLCSEMPFPSHRAITFINPSIPCVSLTEHLAAAGYLTAWVTPGDLDFDQQRQFLRYREIEHLVDAKSLPGIEGAWMGPWGVEDHFALKHALELVDGAGEQPFFVLLNPLAGHHPFIATEAQARSPKPTRVENYLEALRVADQITREAIEGLEARGVLDDTLVVVVADHGEGHGARAGRNAWQPVVHVPMFLFGPQTRRSGGRVTLTTSQLDLAPTILGLLDLPVPCTMKGRDLTKPAEPRLALFGGRPPRYQVGLADAGWKFILEDGSIERLFDLRTDPKETHNLLDQHPELAAQYRQRVEAWEFHAAELIENYATRLEEVGCLP